MGIVRDLKNINKTLEEQNTRSTGSGVRFLKVNDGETKKIRFLQELDSDSPNYNPDAGTGFVAVEHSDPSDFRRKMVCTIDDEDACYGCEQHQLNYKAGWRQKSKLYVNVAVEELDENKNTVWNVYVLSQGNGPKSVTGWLLDYAGDAGTITDRTFRLKRKGKGQTDTEYTLSPAPNSDAELYDVTQHELWDLEKAVNQIPYAEQAAFFAGGGNKADDSSDESTAW